MAKAPPIPPEQRAFRGEKPDIEGATQGPRDENTGEMILSEVADELIAEALRPSTRPASQGCSG